MAFAVDGEIVLFQGASGTEVKRAVGTGYAKLASGVLSSSALVPMADVNGLDTALAGKASSVHAHTLAAGFTTNIDGGGVAIAAGQITYVKVPWACTFLAWEVVANASGSISVAVARAPTATPTTYTTISGTSPPALSSQQSAKDTDLSEWADVTLDTGDWLRFTVSSAAVVALVAIAFDVNRIIT